MITELTTEQAARLDEFKDRWIKIGLDTDRSNRAEAEKWIAKAYESAGLTPPPKFVWVESPMQAVEKAKEMGATGDGSQMPNFCFGAHEAPWLSFYNYCLEVLTLDCCKALEPHFEIAKYCGWWLPFDEAAIISEKPVEIHMNSTQVLHNEKGPAIRYSDGFCVWALNGIRVPQNIVETPWDKLDPQLVVKETNAEIRREIVRKIGIERVISGLNAKVIDKEGDYELLTIDLGDKRERPYLKMINPSIGVYHIEGVPPGTATVKAALAFRNGTEEAPVSIT